MTPPRAPRPVPAADGESAPFWEAANEERLALQRCLGCAAFHHPPVALCTRCGGTGLAFATVSGRGRIDSFTIVHETTSAAFRDSVPYVVAAVELIEEPGLLLLTNMPDTPPEVLRAGLPVEAWFEEIAPGVRIPQFRVARA